MAQSQPEAAPENETPVHRDQNENRVVRTGNFMNILVDSYLSHFNEFIVGLNRVFSPFVEAFIGRPRSDTEPKCPISNVSVVSNTCTCDHNGGVINSKNGDIKLHIPEGAIKDGDVVKFYFATALYGSFVFHSHCQTDLVSPYYWIGVSGSYCFQKPVQIQFEHFAAVTNPSHYRLFTCEDDDKSNTMRSVDYNLGVKVQGDRSWFTYLTKHFCSYCLLHNYKGLVVNKITAFCLKPKNFQVLDHFTIEIWFSLPISYCVQRNTELYTKKGMILDTDCSYVFEASCDASSENYFSFNYIANMDGWYLDNSLSKKILTKEVNFYNYYKSVDELRASEENSLYPPRFVFHVTKKYKCTTDLDTDIMVTLYNHEKGIIFKPFKLFVSVSPSPISTADVLTIPSHCCDNNKPTLQELITYSTKISHLWKEIAIQLGISKSNVFAIDADYQSVADKCYEMFIYWLKNTERSICWCQFVEALCNVGLNQVAQEAATRHLEAYEQSCTSKLASLYLSPRPNELKKYVELIPDIDLYFFVYCLLPKESAIQVIKQIKRSNGSKEDNINIICKAFLNEKNPSWTKVCRALKEADCDDLADIVELQFLTCYEDT